MSLYTPVFPSSHETNTAQKLSSRISSAGPSYVEILRDVHLFLSSQSELLSPPSRPMSPTFDDRVQKLREDVQEAFCVAEGEPASGKWVYLSEKLRMGCVRGRYYRTNWREYESRNSAEEELQWILPEEEEAWFKWERTREERRSKTKTRESRNSKELIPTASLGKQTLPHPQSAEQELQISTAKHDTVVSPRTLKHVTDKVTKWKATMPSDGVTRDDVAPAPVVLTASEETTTRKGKDLAKGSRESSSLGFPVVKRSTTTATGKKNRDPTGRPAAVNSQDSIGAARQNKTNDLAAREGTAAERNGSIDMASSRVPLKPSLPPDYMPKITDIPEAPYLPPSFPSQLETSTPQPLREKPPAILPCAPSSSSPPPSSYVDNPVLDHQHGLDRAPNISSSLPLPKTPRQPLKRARSVASPSTRKDTVISLASPPAKRSRTDLPSSDAPSSITNPITPVQQPAPEVSHGQALGDSGDAVLSTTPPRNLPTLDELLASSRRSKPRPRPPSRKLPFTVDTASAGHIAPLRPQTPIQEENPSPTKSYFSSPASPSESPGSPRGLLLRSPVSPMLSFAQNPNAFLPQYTSTQQPGVKGGPSTGRTGSGLFGMGYSSQFDVEGHVDRVSELLEKDVDFDGWLRDIPGNNSLDELEPSRGD